MLGDYPTPAFAYTHPPMGFSYGSSRWPVCQGDWEEPLCWLVVDGWVGGVGERPVNCKRDEHLNLLCPMAGRAEQLLVLVGTYGVFGV